MQTYVSILRAINVGKRKVLMADLKKLYEKLGFEDATTYIQSGNVIFKTKKEKPQSLAKKIADAMEKKYGFEVPVIVREAEALAAILTTNPYLEKKLPIEKLHVTFLSEAPAAALAKSLGAVHFPPDECVLFGQEVYLHTPGGYGETKLSNTFFEKTLKVTATTRNWKTVSKLAEMAEH